MIVAGNIPVNKTSSGNTLVFADFVTFMNAGCGLVSIIFIIEKNLFFSSLFILLAAVFDFLDGKIARLSGKSSNLGFFLDSLADIVSFGVAPALLFYSSFPGTMNAVLSLFILLSGIYRLARYSVYNLPLSFSGHSGIFSDMETDVKKKHDKKEGSYKDGSYVIKEESDFKGMPITVNGILLSFMVLSGLYGIVVFSEVVFQFAVLLSSVLMASKIKFPRF